MRNIRTGPVGYNNPSQNDAHVFMDKERKYHAITLGAGSYCDDVVLEFGGGRMCHILIGRYTSIGQAIFVL